MIPGIMAMQVRAAIAGLNPNIGITWTARTTPVDNSWVSVCWSPALSLFVAVAISGTGNRVMTSL